MMLGILFISLEFLPNSTNGFKLPAKAVNPIDKVRERPAREDIVPINPANFFKEATLNNSAILSLLNSFLHP